ncbi:hypothetical protein DIT68_10115 [Brumimicrobium oceani]|uniref:Uncharacterized protein n=1 Tax=Brumimicrobium oceani TaxID=2100725 RepID=A0A2U2XBV6_9FLAO|nr:hypothetical protein DIT68_10115 [Brumimicrobium oceani]
MLVVFITKNWQDSGKHLRFENYPHRFILYPFIFTKLSDKSSVFAMRKPKNGNLFGSNDKAAVTKT